GEGLKISNLNPSKSPFDKGDFVKLVDELRFNEAINLIFEKYIDKSNTRLNEVTPWRLETNDPTRIAVLTECAENLREAATYLEPIMPEVAKKILGQLKGEIKPMENALFPRIR
ncbi:MAG: hypothetical protein PHR98_03555, partial [Candidatus Shapirobacteria bacterium]|nr:hypothetical protein [Candidatus Shapirobacteria bacterium]